MQVEFSEGTVVRFSASFKDDSTNSPVNPSQVAFAYRVNGGAPTQALYVSGNEDPGTIVNDAVGSFHIDIDSTGLDGSWTFLWDSKGFGQASKSGAITVSKTPMTIVWAS